MFVISCCLSKALFVKKRGNWYMKRVSLCCDKIILQRTYKYKYARKCHPGLNV